jgi:ABC-2 type transport system ATP-binding protein
MVLNHGECRRFATMSDMLSEAGDTNNNSALEEAYFTITQDQKKFET